MILDVILWSYLYKFKFNCYNIHDISVSCIFIKNAVPPSHLTWGVSNGMYGAGDGLPAQKEKNVRLQTYDNRRL